MCVPPNPTRIGLKKCWVLCRENRRTWRKTLGARKRTNNNSVIWLYQLSWKCKLATVMSIKLTFRALALRQSEWRETQPIYDSNPCSLSLFPGMSSKASQVYFHVCKNLVLILKVLIEKAAKAPAWHNEMCEKLRKRDIQSKLCIWQWNSFKTKTKVQKVYWLNMGL